jgi:hypothetical protein
MFRLVHFEIRCAKALGRLSSSFQCRPFETCRPLYELQYHTLGSFQTFAATVPKVGSADFSAVRCNRETPTILESRPTQRADSGPSLRQQHIHRKISKADICLKPNYVSL